MKQTFSILFILLILIGPLSGCSSTEVNATNYFEATVMDRSATYLLVRPSANFPEAYYAEMMQVICDDIDAYHVGDIVAVNYKASSEPQPGEVEAIQVRLLQAGTENTTDSTEDLARMAGTLLSVSPDSHTVDIATTDDMVLQFHFPDTMMDLLSELSSGDTLIFNYEYSSDQNRYNLKELISSEPQPSDKTAGEQSIQKIYAYLNNYNKELHSVQIDWIEWVTPRDTKRIANLGLTEKDMAPGYYIINEKEIYYNYKMAEHTVIQLLDPISGSLYSSSAEELGKRLMIEQDTGKRAYQVTIIDNIVTDITSAYEQ